MTSRDQSAGLGFEQNDASPAFAYEEWKLYDFTEVERDVWIAEGLRPGQARLARDLRLMGFQPSDLNTDVYGWSVAKRLRADDKPAEILRLLRRQQNEHGAG